MAQNGTTEHDARLTSQLFVGSAVLGAVFAYFAFTLLTIPVLDVVFGMEIFHYSNFPLGGGIVAVAGVGLLGAVRRYRTSRVRAGALVGVGVMTVVGFVQTWGFWKSDLVVPVLVTVPAGLLVLAAVTLLTRNPGGDAGEPGGFVILWRTLPFLGDSPDDDGHRESGGRRESTTGDQPGWEERLPVSGYWAFVGGAFAVCTPIAFVNPELGLGLLSALLTAYGLSLRVESQSSDVDEDG